MGFQLSRRQRSGAGSSQTCRQREWPLDLTTAAGEGFPSGLLTCQLETRIAASRITHPFTTSFFIAVSKLFCYFGKLYFKDFISRV